MIRAGLPYTLPEGHKDDVQLSGFYIGRKTPSVQILPMLGPKVYKWCLLFFLGAFG